MSAIRVTRSPPSAVPSQIRRITVLTFREDKRKVDEARSQRRWEGCLYAQNCWNVRLCRAMRGIRWPSKAITPEMPQHSWGYLMKCVMALFEDTLRELIEPAAPHLTFMPADIQIPHVGNIHGIQAVMKVLTYPQQIVRRAARQP